MDPEPTARELHALRAYLSCGSVKDAADALDVAPQTIKNHLSSVYVKLGCGGAIEAARALGWLRVPGGYGPCGWTGTCTRPSGHRGSHGGWTAAVHGRER